MVTRIWFWGLSALLSVTLVGCERSAEPVSEAEMQAPAVAAPEPAQPVSAANVSNERLLNAAAEPSQWMSYGGTHDEQRYSRLTQINTENVKDLGLAWFADFDSNLSQNGTPLYIDGVIYAATPWSVVYAFDAATGEELWRYDPKTPREWARKVCCGLVNRGIAAWNGKIYIGTFDAKLVAIDAATGEEVWSTLTFDERKMDSPIHRYSITSAPRVAKGKVFIGNSGSEYGVRGYVSAFDAETGELVWRFYTVPGNPAEGFENEQMEMAARTWSGEWWKIGGGGTVWDSTIYDPVTDLVFIGTGNGTPWNQQIRDPETGDNLFLASIIALNPDTGEYVWHYQTTPAETWDYDATSPLMAVTLTLDGQERRVILQPCKNGFFYMLDAATGELLRAEPFTEINWADGVDMATGRPRVRPEARYEERPFNLLPGVQGAHGWHSNAYSPETGLIYIPTQHAYSPMVVDPDYQQSDVGFNLGINFGASFTFYNENPDEPRGFESFLQAWDPIAGKQVWRGEATQRTTGAALATAGGLIFQGGGSNQEFRAYDAGTGEKLWSMQAQTAVLAAPITFELDDRQYVAVSVGGSQTGGYYAPNYSRLLVYALNGNLELPPVQEFVPRPLDPPPATAAAEVVAAGSAHYSQYCAICHGDEGETRGSASPNLTTTPMLHSQEAFDSVVLQGALIQRGMGAFADALNPEDSQAIRAYIVARANEIKNALPPAAGPPPVTEEEVLDQPHEEQ
jgi:PQQ-dependent dehydrogenase (methanol/ethanol family)